MIFATIAGWLVRLGVSSSAAKRIAPFTFGGALIAAIALAFGIWLHFHDRGVVSADRATTEAQVAKTALGADRAANASDAPRQAEIQANDTDTRKAIDNASAQHPEAAHAAAGPAANAAAASLRARAARTGSPAR